MIPNSSLIEHPMKTFFPGPLLDHSRNIMRKLRLDSVVALTRYAIRKGYTATVAS